MKKYFLATLLTTTLVLTLSLGTPALAESSDGISKQQAVEVAQQVYPGRVLAVKRKGSAYHVKTLNKNGEVRIILVDAQTGKVISQR